MASYIDTAGLGVAISLLKTEIDKKDVTYTNENPTTAALGGIEQGETFDGLTVQEMLDKLLYPYVATEISAFKVSPTISIKENGTTTTYTGASVTLVKGSVDINCIEIVRTTDNEAIVTTSASNFEEYNTLSTGETYTFEFSFSESVTKAYNGYCFRVDVTESNNTTISLESTSFNYVYPYYYGSVDADVTSLTSSEITSLTKSVTAKGTKSFTYTTDNQKMVVAYPASYGVLKTIYDPNSFSMINDFTYSTVDVTGKDGTAVSYYVYIQNSAATNSSFTMKYGY